MGLRKMILAFSIAMLGLAGTNNVWAGPVADDLANYSLGGAGLGALIGTASATIPFLNDKQAFDFAVGAGTGALAGSVVGLLLGVFDVALHPPQASSPALSSYHFGVPVLAYQGSSTYLGWTAKF